MFRHLEPLGEADELLHGTQVTEKSAAFVHVPQGQDHLQQLVNTLILILRETGHDVLPPFVLIFTPIVTPGKSTVNENMLGFAQTHQGLCPWTPPPFEKGGPKLSI